MPATIQKILKPTEYRAVDTSTSEHFVSQELITNTDFESASSNWTLIYNGGSGSGATMDAANTSSPLSGSKDLKLTNNAGENAGVVSNGISFVSGRAYKVSFNYLCNHNTNGKHLKVKVADSNTQTGGANIEPGFQQSFLSASSKTLYEFYVYPTETETNYLTFFIADGGVFQIDDISVKEVANFGNNNHGNIYSGRALQFDGVSDYLNTGYIPYEGSAYGNITYAMWLKPETASPSDNQLYFDDRVASSRGFHGYIRSTSGILEFRCTDTGDNANIIAIDTTGAELTNSWIRLCLVYDASAGSYGTIYAYANGQLKGSSALTAAFTSVGANNLRIGANTNNIKLFEGKVSDFQVWDTALTASDALYDYLNPESLALNNGGTSLTESNLKLWYPMQDGYRGNDEVGNGKHFIMDGANTGLGDDIVNWTSTFSGTGITTDGDIGSWVSNAGDNGDTHTYIDNDNKTIRLKSDDGEHVELKILNSLTVGVAYKFVVTVDSISGTFRIRPGANEPDADMTTAGTHSFYFASSASDYWRIERDSGVGDITVSDIKIYPINEKHHAEAIFYGDELVTNSDCESAPTVNSLGLNGNGTHDVATIALSTEQANGGSKSIKVTADSSSSTPNIKFVNGDASNADGSDLGLVAGRTYAVSADVYLPASQGMTSLTLYTTDGSGSGTALETTTTTGSWVTLNGEFVDNDADVPFRIQGGSASDCDDDIFYVDNISIKEVGTADGWSEASQELDIPQPVLQSFNELAWFPGTDSGTDFDINCGSDSTIDDIFNGGGTVSAWIYPVGSETQWIVHKGHGTAPDSGWYIGIQNLNSGNYVLRLDASFDGAENGRWDTDLRLIKQGAWNHIAVNWNDDSIDNNPTIFINGESVDVDENETPSDGSSYNPDASRDFLIGNSHGGGKPFGGAITEVSLWDTGLSTAQVGELYNDGKALDALTHSLASSNLKAYWRNNGLATWKDLKNSNDGTVNNVSETILIPAGVDSSRDTQGFIMNRQKVTNALNVPAEPSGVRGSSVSGPYVWVPQNPISSSAGTVSNFSCSYWMKLTDKPSNIIESGQGIKIFDTYQSDAKTAFRMQLNHNNILYCYVNYGSSSNNSIYLDYDLDNLDNATVTNPHSFGTDGEWNGAQDSMSTSVGINQYSDGSGGSNFENEWLHIAVSYDHDRDEGDNDNTSMGSETLAPYYLYINGIIVAKESRQAGTDANNATARTMQAVSIPMIIGNDMNSSGTGVGNQGATFPGYIDDLLFYSDTLTAKEVLRIYNAGKRSHR